jgi:hypothetical protein
VCSISGATVTFNQAGTCVIDANQAGNECGHLNWPRLGVFSSRMLAPPGW